MIINNHHSAVGLAGMAALLLCGQTFALESTEEDYELKLLGKYVFYDKISNPSRMACVTCHDPNTGGTGSVSGVNLHQVGITGANPHTVGGLKPPTNMYASFIAPYDERCGFGPPNTNQACGGNFWNGRGEGRGADQGGALYPDSATKHIGEEVFQGITDPAVLEHVSGYAGYFGPTSDQALNPMPNPVEQNIDRQSVCQHVSEAKYAELYERSWGVAIDCSDVPVAVSAVDAASKPEKAYDISFKRIMLAVGAWQHSSDLNSFSSKRDIALRAELACLEGVPDADPAVCNHDNFLNSPGNFPLVGLTDQENLGHDLFYNRRPIPFAPRAEDGGPPFNVSRFPGLPEANCAFCHSDKPGPVGPGPRDNGSELFQLYADDAFHNIGTPANPELPADPDPGLAGHSGLGQGSVKTPTVRNVDKRKGKGFIKAYTHNGWFKSLESLIHFYNTAAIGRETAESYGVTRCPEDIKTEKDALANICWPAPEWGNGGGAALIGNLGMSEDQEAALVAYLKTLTDMETPKPPKPYKPSK